MIPTYVPKKHEAKWETINNIYGKGNTGTFAANTWLKKEIAKPVQVRQSLSFSVDKSHGRFIQRSEDGDDYVSLVLNTTDPHKDGRVFSEQLLKKWEKQINSNGIVGDIDHEEYYKLLMSGMTDEQVKFALKQKSGIAKAIRAIYDNGKLWIRALIDKRYKNAVEKSQGVSVEAVLTEDDGAGIELDGDILGFTFNVNTSPAQYGVGVAA